jgi:shikimate kinase
MTPPALLGRSLALVGYRGTGKSTVGRLLAARLGREFLDADVLFVESAGQSIRQFFESLGESAFRDREEAILHSVIGRPNLVLATGGGAVLRESNRHSLKKLCRVAWLSADVRTLTERLTRDDEQMSDRPALTAAGTLAEVADVVRFRAPFYREVADVTIDTTNRSPEQVAEDVLEALSLSFLKPEPDHVVG